MLGRSLSIRQSTITETMSFWLSVAFLLSLCVAQQETRDIASCACGFYDQEAGLVYTDASIVYFNETSSIPDDLIVESFAHKYDRGWNSLYRQGAAVDNVALGHDASARNKSSLSMYCDPADNNHLVVGSSIRTAREDLFFGSFRSSLRAPRAWHKGSALSMVLEHNLTESWSMDVMNTDNSSWAWVTMLMQSSFPDLWFGANFTNLSQENMDPWYYTEYRVDWSRDRLDYYIGGRLQKSYTRHGNGSLPSTPAALRWQHWSLGNMYSTGGPPQSRSEANIAWTRIFFNSSLMTDAAHEAFDARCSPADACPMSDNSLRGSSVYPADALKPWKQKHPPYRIRWAPLIIVIIFSSVFTLLTTKTLWRRFWNDTLVDMGLRKSSTAGDSVEELNHSPEASLSDSPIREDGHTPGASSSYLPLPPPSYKVAPTPAPEYRSPAVSRRPSRLSATQTPGGGPGSSAPDSYLPPTAGVLAASLLHSSQQPERGPGEKASASPPSGPTTTQPETQQPGSKPSGSNPEGNAPPRQRIDYLAGFISVSAILVTMNHFGLTFWAAVIIPSVLPHYQSETWARKTIATYFLDPLWIGPFLMISTRFLVSNYLRTGNLSNMAQKVVARPFRLLTPVASIALLQYFLIDAGAVNWLEYLPSVTWSSWPFTSIVANPGVFISEVIQLAYLIPNGAPMITYNYCTGVLWTIPVQLQGAWQTLLALLMIKQCKTPWKRMAFYAFSIINHWYGLSWASYYYAGVLLADLDITYKYKPWLHARPFLYYPVLWLLILVALGGFTIDLVPQWNGVQYALIEHNWHPDINSGLSLGQAGNTVYPDYFIPRLNAWVSTVSMQAVVEICPLVQKILSVKFLQFVFPHIFTIYLIHGFIFWSIGSWAMITLFSYGLPYWLCVLLVFIITYFVLFASLPLLTPPIEMLGRSLALRIWAHATEEPVPRQPTTWPFGVEFLAMREVNQPPKSPASASSDPACEKGKKVDRGAGTEEMTTIETIAEV